jgi:replicative DNA helicase Mcm
MEREEIIEIFSQFIRENYYEKLLKAVSENVGFLLIDFSLLDKFSPELASYLLENPEETIEICEEAIKQIDTGLAEAELRLRFVNLPEDRQIRIRNIRSQHLGKMIVVDGFVKRASEIRPEVCEIVYECLECGNTITMVQKERVLKAPEKCEACGSKKFKPVKQKFYDARWIVVEEPYEITTGERPSELMIYLKEDLTSPKMQNKTEPGNRIKVVGILKELPRKVKGTRSKQMEIYLDANSVESVEVGWEEFEITPEDEKKILELAKDPDIYYKFIQSIAPSMYGMEEVKEALLLQLVGGEPHLLEDGTRIRGNIHILLVGDPASGKSQLMQYISKLIPRGRYVSGSGVTGVGLTATVTRDEEFLGGWVLEAGAIVMSNKSVCCLHPSTKIIINNKILPIENLFDGKNSEKILCNGEIMEICKLKGFVPSLNLKSLRVKERVSNLVRRKRYEGKILKIKLDSGFEIKVTPEHMLIDGNTLSWKKAEDFKEGEFLLAPLYFPGENKKIYIFDLIPEDWKICLTKKEKNEIKAEIIKKYKSIAEFSRKLNLPKKILYGGCQPTLKQFKDIIKELKVVEKWVKKPLKYGRKCGRIRLKTADVTPELAYVLGFILGDGYLSRKEGHAGMRITQSIKHKLFNKKFIENWNKVFPKELHEWEDNRESKIRGRNVKSNSKVLYFGSNLLVLLYDKLIGKNLEKILCLPTEVLKSFIAGVFDSDGCISVKKGKKKNKEYKVAHVEFLISKNPEINKNFMLALRKLEVYSKLIETDKNVDIIRITGREDVVKLKNSICKYSEKINLKEIPEKIHKVSSSSDKLPAFFVAEICKKILEEINTTLLNKYGLRAIYPYKNLKYQPSREEMEKIIRKIGKDLSCSTRREIEKLLQRDFFLDKIVKIEKEDYDGFVFDLFVPKTNNFVADGIFVHNCIDEFSKVSPGDRVALQEAMSLETISIAKASIVATLPAQTAILAGANPKLGRFDPYLPIREQVDIDDVLLSRFDLKFALRDVPNPEIDAKMAEHILKVRHLKTEEAKPIIPPELLRKYIAYARSRIHPVLTKEAGELLMNFYLEMRKKSGEEAPIAITLRQYEALIRLAEASAKIQLRNFVTREDAERAIRLMKISLREFGFEPETGMFDIDRAEGQRVTAAQRSKIRIMIDILDELTAIHGKNIPQEEFLKRAREEGVEDAEEILRKMISEGIIFQPKPGFIQKV